MFRGRQTLLFDVNLFLAAGRVCRVVHGTMVLTASHH